ncbi:MAG: hypothetical protein CSA76_01655 [Spirochaetales bacterium]|nr:MAG: hypothetical protein CSA76_01655 [Spirochaetales bacterium]
MSDSDNIKVEIQDIDPEEQTVRSYAPLLFVKGALGIIAGIILLFWPGTGLAAVAVLLGIFLVADGIERLVSVLRYPVYGKGRDALAITGAVLRIIFGAVVLVHPGSAGSLWASVFFIAAGINLIIGSLFFMWKSKEAAGDYLLTGTSIVMLLLGLILILLPVVSAHFLLRIAGILLILSAVPALALALRYR